MCISNTIARLSTSAIVRNSIAMRPPLADVIDGQLLLSKNSYMQLSRRDGRPETCARLERTVLVHRINIAEVKSMRRTRNFPSLSSVRAGVFAMLGESTLAKAIDLSQRARWTVCCIYAVRLFTLTLAISVHSTIDSTKRTAHKTMGYTKDMQIRIADIPI